MVCVSAKQSLTYCVRGEISAKLIGGEGDHRELGTWGESREERGEACLALNRGGGVIKKGLKPYHGYLTSTSGSAKTQTDR